MLSPGTAVCWQVARRFAPLRGQIVAVIEAGTAPAQIAPELIGLKTTQVKFGGLLRPRVHTHYLIKREECTDRGIEHACYYLPLACCVQSVRESSEPCAAISTGAAYEDTDDRRST